MFQFHGGGSPVQHVNSVSLYALKHCSWQDGTSNELFKSFIKACFKLITMLHNFMMLLNNHRLGRSNTIENYQCKCS